VEGSEQGGNRPVVCIANPTYLRVVNRLFLAIPVTTTRRGWANHVRIAGDRTGLVEPSWAMTEQIRTLSRSRIKRVAGRVSPACLKDITDWVRDFLSDAELDSLPVG
jgi:mRNA interferase MazF